MANKISVVLDFVADKANASVKGFKQSIQDTDGATNKFKAGAASAFDSVKGAAAGLALGAGAALVTFGIKAATAFTDTALSAGKFADATGLATEEASRWTAVADDIGISGEAMEKAFGKLAVSVGKNNPLLEEYGITVQKGADGQDDMNATMLNAIDVIKGIQDPTKKAAVAQAALGRGWMDMAELIEQGSGSLTESMAKVSEAQVIDPAEVEKARKMRESLDNLQDAMNDVALVLGEELVPELALAADGFTKLLSPIMKVHKWSKDISISFGELTGIIDDQKAAIDPLVYGYGHLFTELDNAAGTGTLFEDVMTGLNAAIEEGTRAADEAKAAQAKLDAAEQRLIQTTETLTNRYRDLKGELSEEEDFHNAEQMWVDLGVSAEAAFQAASTGAEDAEQKARDHEGAVIDAKQAVVELGDKYKDLPEEKITNIVALIDAGSLAEAEAAFNNLVRNRTMNVDIVSKGGAGFGVGTFAEGGTVPGPVGKPQLAIVHGGEYITPANTTGWSGMSGGAAGGVTFHAEVHTTGAVAVADVTRALTLARLSR